MASMAEQPFAMYQPQQQQRLDADEFARYPDPAHTVFTCGPTNMTIAADAFSAHFRTSHDVYPTTMAFDPALYAEAPSYLTNTRTSPTMYAEDGDLRIPASDLSAPSSASSTISSPESHHGQMGPLSDWRSHPLDMQPSIVNNDYMVGADYTGFPQSAIEELSFSFAPTNKAFVGESAGESSSSTFVSSAYTALTPKSCRVSAADLPRVSLLSLAGDATPPARVRPETSPDEFQVVGYAEQSASPQTPTPFSLSCSFPSSFSGDGRLSSPPVSACWSCSKIVACRCMTRLTDSLNSIDPSLIHPEISRAPIGVPAFDPHFVQPNHHYPASPSATSSPQPAMMRNNSSSPFHHNAHYQPAFNNSPYPAPMDTHVRRQSGNAFISPTSNGDYQSSDDAKEKQRCTCPDCGKVYKDLKAHMLTHQNERPEKCPIQTCEYHVKGFARKYDKNRHTLTHYKGTMVCGFCPGSGSAAEKSFNRADVFKRHLTAVHGVEQTPPNSRKKASAGMGANKKLTGYASDATGKCSTCSQTFSNAQDFYEHLDDCVLRIVQQEDPAEAINAQRLAEVENDKLVRETLEKNSLPTTTQTSPFDDDEDDFDMGDDEDIEDASGPSPAMSKKKTNPANGVQKSRGMTHSRGGVQLSTKTKGRKNRRDYPSSWGFDKGRMTMKKRVMAIFDGPRRLAKDDMMLCTDNQVRLTLADGKSYITDFDIHTLQRAEAFHNATDEEKGPWISDDPTEEQLNEMRQMLAMSPASV
jgi:hypothetical protein